jgi:hypothetical protein
MLENNKEEQDVSGGGCRVSGLGYPVHDSKIIIKAGVV